MALYILVSVAVLVLLFLAIAATRPAAFTCERSLVIAAPPQAIYPHIDNFHNWRAWSPYEKLDPNAKHTYSGPESGVGASMSWSGTSKMGEGSTTIVATTPHQLIAIKLVMVRPFAATNDVQFLLSPQPSGTKVTWHMAGRYNLIAKAMHMVIDMDKMVGKDFAEGLQLLKSIVESNPTP